MKNLCECLRQKADEVIDNDEDLAGLLNDAATKIEEMESSLEKSQNPSEPCAD